MNKPDTQALVFVDADGRPCACATGYPECSNFEQRAEDEDPCSSCLRMAAGETFGDFLKRVAAAVT